jgi:hypothetical protein
MRFNYLKTSLKTAVLATTVLLLGAGLALAQQQVGLTAGPTTLSTPDGATVPMWGYACGTTVSGSTATCAKLNPAAAGWSPVVITVPTGQDLQINLTNSLTFTGGNIPTSLVIVGQLGGGLGTTATTTPAPDHSQAQANVTWPIAGAGGGNPPTQGPRVQSFSTEVAYGTTANLLWKAPRPGTYLIESGTHPSIQGPMGLYGILVVTTAPTGGTAGTAYPSVSYSAEVPLLLSEIDPIQNNAVSAAVNTVNFKETNVWSGQPGGCGNPSSPTYRTCYPPAVNYSPLYYLFNGVALDKTNAAVSLFPVSPATGVTGTVLVRLVNAGLHMHVPSIVGAQTGSALPGFGLIAEDGNPLPGVTRVQSEVFLAPGKTYDVTINAPAAVGTAMPIFDRELSLSGNATVRDAGMLAYISINGAALPISPAFTAAVANPDSYNSLIPGQTFTVSDPAKGVIANDNNVYGVKVTTPPTNGAVTLNANGTFTYVPAGTSTTDSFTYCGNGTASGPACAQVTLGAAPIEGASGITCNVPTPTYSSNVATTLSIKPPGVLAFCKDALGYPLAIQTASTALTGSGTGVVSVDPNGGFNATLSAASAGNYTFSFTPKNSQGTSGAPQTITLAFPTANGPTVSVVDGKDKTTPVLDYRWIIEEDRTFFIDPNRTTNTGTTVVPTFGTNFHTSYMPIVATGCTGTLSCESGQTVLGQAAVCDIGNGVCRTTATQQTTLDPSQVHLDPTKRYYLSVLPGDASNPFDNGNLAACTSPSDPTCGHGMGGAPVAPGQTFVKVLVQPTPLPTARVSVFVFEDDFPLNGEQDAGGGIDVLAVNEPGLGQFNITLFDDAGGSGDSTGQMTYDMFNMPLSNSLAGTIDPATGQDACPISTVSRVGVNDPTQTGITGTIVTCPRYEAGGTVLSPLAGQAVVVNLMPGRYGVVATPGADRIARGEEWLQTDTLDGQKALDSFIRASEPGYFQEYGPAGYHVSIGFANPAIINGRLAGICAGSDPNLTGTDCKNTVKGKVTTARLSRTPDERLYSSGSRDSFAFTQCFASIGDPDGEDFAFAKCDSDGVFTLNNIPDGTWRVTLFDQWNDQITDGLSTPVVVSGGKLTDMGDIATQQWHANIYTRTFIDTHGDGISHDDDPGIPLWATNIRYRDGSFSNFNNTDLNGFAAFNEEFPLFNWYVVETDSTRYKNTGTHVVYDAGGPADGSPACGTPTNGVPACGNSAIAKFLANTNEPADVALPAALRVPGAVYCDNADCAGFSIANGPGSSATGSTGRIDPPWVQSEGWQGFIGQNSFLEFGKKPFAEGENGGIHGTVVYASTRPFDDPTLLLQTSWEPLVPNVTINLYQESTAPDGSTALKLVDTTLTSSWDDWAQGFRSDGNPNMSCPGQSTADLFYFTLFNQPDYLDTYGNGGTPAHTIPNNSQFKCYDGLHNWNQLQPAPYDGMYQFPSVTARNPQTGAPAGTNCTICIADPDTTDTYRSGIPMLPKGKYVVEVVVPPGYELVKEEDKNILIGDNFIAPVTQEFDGLGNIYILPDQAAIGAAYNANNSDNPTQALGSMTFPRHEGDTGTIESYWPCVGASRTVPDYISLYPGSHEVSPFAGATRNLCDRKEITVDDETAPLAKFYIFTSTHAAAHYTGIITDDFTSEFDPFSPTFGEKFSPPNLPISIKDWTGAEISRVYSDQWGTFNGLNYSTWEVNPPNPTGYAPTMMVTCMNDPGPIPDPAHPGQMIKDPLFNPDYSNFCYEIPFMPGQTQYMDTPVVPTAAFVSAGYNNPDCAYPDATPAISEVDGDGVGPWVSAAGHTLTIKALGDQIVNNYAYAGPSAAAAPFNAKTTTRHYGFGNTQGTVTIGGVTAGITGWSDSTITVNVPNSVPACAVQQQAQYGGSSARCGELAITAANGKQSIDTVTVTIGGKAPTHVGASGSIQSAIDAAKPGDLIIVDPTCSTASGPASCSAAGVTTHTVAAHSELLLMWKPVQLQGVGAASSIIDANTQPAGKIDGWRARVNCLFGLALDGQPFTSLGSTGGSNPYDSTGANTCGGWFGFNSTPNNPQVDRLPLEGIVGWDTTVNGNLAELLQEPSLMGAYEGAGITVLSKGVKIPPGSTNVFGAGSEAGFPAGSTLLTANDCGNSATPNPYPSNFQCNPSSIDGLAITDSSQGGGGIFVHAWGHNIQIANNRLYTNAGTLAGGINVGQGEFPEAYLQGDPDTSAPGSCQSSSVANTQLPYCFDLNVNVHHNSITMNSSTGDELFSSSPAGAGGVSFCTGADYYKFNNNWVCGNLSTGDGGGFSHIGFIYNGDIENNSFLFNQSTNPTVPTNGGGLLVMGAPPDGNQIVNGVATECGSVTDNDCVPGLGDGTGPNLVINANLINGNAAESGSGGGIRFQSVNGTDVPRFPSNPNRWHSVTVTNNIITNNVAGWDGAGVSLEDALVVNLINNTIVSNDTTASSGVLFNTLGAPLASSQSPPPNTTNSATTSAPQPAGIVSLRNSPQLVSSFTTGPVVCPTGHGTGGTGQGGRTNGACTKLSYPLMTNNMIWQNRTFYIGVGALSSTYQQNVVSLFNSFTTTPAASQPQGDATQPNGNGVIITGGTGACTPGTSNWDIGVRGDTGPTDHSSGFTLAPTYSVLTDATDYPGLNNTGANPTVVSQYCNGSRVPPEFGGSGYAVPPGVADATVPNPIFSLTPNATVDEGNNWVNISWGPLALANPVTGTLLGNYAPAAGSSAIDVIPAGTTAYTEAPTFDFFGNRRKGNGVVQNIDIGAVEFTGANTAPTLTSIAPNIGARGTSVPVTITGTNLAGTTAVGVSGTGVTAVITGTPTATSVTATFTITTTATLSARNVTVNTTSGNATLNGAFTVVRPPAPTLASIAPNLGVRGRAVPVTLTGANFTTTGTTVAVSGGGGPNSIAISAVTVVDSSHITATFTIPAGAAATARNVTVNTTGGNSNAVTFTVQGATLTSVAPNTGLRGSSVPVTLTGTNLTGATTVTISGGGVTATGVTVVNSTTVTATFNITAGATLSTRNVTVNTPIGAATLIGAFTVGAPPAPTLTSISPVAGTHNTTVPVTLTGANLTGTSGITVSGGGITVSGITVVNPTTLTANFAITNGAGRNARTVRVTTPGGNSNTVTFTVN